MKSFAATLCDGRIAMRREVSVEVDGDEVRISGDFEPMVIPRGALTPGDPVAGTPRTLHLAGGGTLVSDARETVDELWPPPGSIARVAFALESRWSAAIGAVALIAAGAWFIVAIVLPTMSEPIAASISPKVEDAIGESALETLDRTVLGRSRLPQSRIDEINDEFDEFLAGEASSNHFRLEFRSMPGANAFALPGGIIVVTDAMVKLTANDDELLAVIAHEIGHERHQHGIRLLLQNSGLAVLVTALAGDAVGMTIMAAALPSVILQSRYSRQFETDADTYAFSHLKRHGKSPQAFADVMRRLQSAAPRADSESGLEQYLNSHPPTDERIRRAEEAR